MTIALVQSTSGNTNIANPSISPVSPIIAGNLMILLVIVDDMNGTNTQITDTQGNTYNVFSADQGNGQTCALYYAYKTVAGTGGLTLPASSPLAWAIHEFSGALATSDPLSNVGSMSLIGSSVSIPYRFDQSGELFFAAILSNQMATFTSTAGTTAQVQNSSNGSLETWWLQSPRITSGTHTFSLNTPASTCGHWATFLHA